MIVKRINEYRSLVVELLAGVDAGIEESKEKLRSFAKKFANRPEIFWHIYRIESDSDIHTVMYMYLLED